MHSATEGAGRVLTKGGERREERGNRCHCLGTKQEEEEEVRVDRSSGRQHGASNHMGSVVGRVPGTQSERGGRVGISPSVEQEDKSNAHFPREHHVLLLLRAL
uniref:Uncharacterized protein n=1 Tax=Physcomitrium patens TaxID=3218 RepID=A0A2K1JIC1_PHYPA|nr:hypothetical protein PHYPA_018449 [Physcomitrium patens]